MKPSGLTLNITSEQPEVLQKFYQEVVGLEVDPVTGGFLMGDALFVISDHSETHGATKEPSRFLFSFRVQDAKAERERMESKGARFIRKEGREYWGGVFSTFVDPDGNYGQLLQYTAPDEPVTVGSEAQA